MQPSLSEQEWKLLYRLKQTQDGKDFIDLLERLSYSNYTIFKENDEDQNEKHKGYAIAVDSLIENFAECEKYLTEETLSEIVATQHTS